MFDYTFKQNALLARKIAASGMVLLENDNILPLKKHDKIAIFGEGQVHTIKGGMGSADVLSPYSVSIAEAVKNSDLNYDQKLWQKYQASPQCMISQAELRELAQTSDTAIMVISRNAGEGADNQNIEGDFLLTETEQELVRNLDKHFNNLVFIINSGNIMDLAWISHITKPKALLNMFHPGMEGGNALVDILTGKETPSAKLTDTIAKGYSDYPSSNNFESRAFSVEYSEGIYVGYRYFETFAPEKVLYPFGYGLSYTRFAINVVKTNYAGDNFTCDCEITNIGDKTGREVLQLYVESNYVKSNRPARVLVAFQKTPAIRSGESCRLQLRVPVSDLAYFDDTPGSRNCGCWVLEQGNYSFFIGNSVRNTEKCGEWDITQEQIIQNCGILFQGGLSRVMNRNGEFETTAIAPLPDDKATAPFKQCQRNPKIMLKHVADNEATLDDFIAQLNADELISLAHAHGPAFPRGTAGIGNLPKYGIVNLQTADGPAGLRKTVPTTAFPCGTLLAASWDEDILFQTGKAIALEARKTGIDVLLAPGLNIHRSPLCGRNFEYYSEDPVIAGKCAAAYVRGVQSEGVAATIKHFVTNNREYFRHYSNSIVSERALREIYLKAFEIAIREGTPRCVMTSYNILNHTRVSANANLITQLLKKEWQYEGLVMTDWRVKSRLFEEILAGSDVKMPLVPDSPEYQEAKVMLESGTLSKKRLEDIAGRVCKLVMASHRFKNQDFGPSHVINNVDSTHIGSLEMRVVTSTWSKVFPCNDSGRTFCHGLLNRDPGGNDTRLVYALQFQKDGNYKFRFRVATPGDKVTLHIKIDQQNTGFIALNPTMSPAEVQEEYCYDKWQTQGDFICHLTAGEHELELRIDDPANLGISLNEIIISPC